jgi:hypothetical protein
MKNTPGPRTGGVFADRRIRITMARFITMVPQEGIEPPTGGLADGGFQRFSIAVIRPYISGKAAPFAP